MTTQRANYKGRVCFVQKQTDGDFIAKFTHGEVKRISAAEHKVSLFLFNGGSDKYNNQPFKL